MEILIAALIVLLVYLAVTGLPAYSIQVLRSAVVNGVSFQSAATVTSNNKIGFSLAGNLAFAGTLTTRTDNDTGVITTTLAHGLSASDFVDVMWSGGTRRRMDITAVTSTTITVDLGTGDNLPVLTTAVTVSKPFEAPAVVVGNNVDGIFVTAPCAGIATFIDAGSPPVELASFIFTTAGAYIWTSSDGTTGVLAGDTTVTVTWSQLDATLAAGQVANGEVLY